VKTKRHIPAQHGLGILPDKMTKKKGLFTATA
jgi:hypothetical protein